MATRPMMISPGVYINEVDLSAYYRSTSFNTIYGLVITAQNGPLNQIVDVNSVDEFVETFGVPISASGYAATAVLRRTGLVKVVRVANSDAQARSIILSGYKAGESTTVTEGEGDNAVTTTVAGDPVAVDNAVQVAYKNKGTLYADVLSISIASISGATDDKFTLTIKKADEVLVNQNFTVIEANATDEYPYLIGWGESDFVFSLASEDPIVKLNTVANANLSAGSNGSTPTDADFTKGINWYDDAENVDLDFLAVPGVTTGAVISKLTEVAENRGDIQVIVDIPRGLTPEEATQFVDGELVGNVIRKIDSQHVWCAYPGGFISNEFTVTSEYMPASVGILDALALMYNSMPRWTAPAGVNNFPIPLFTEMERKLSVDDRDVLYESNINPICNFRGLGITQFGQKTMQRKTTSTDRLNVRILVNYIRKLVQFSTFKYLFRNIDDKTFDDWKFEIGSILKDILDGGGLYAYKVKMDWDTVTAEDVNNNTMPGAVQVKPTKTAEYIPIDLVLRNRDDSFGLV